MATNKVQTGLRLEVSLHKTIKVLAKTEHRSFNNLVEHILQSYIHEYEMNHGLIQTEDTGLSGRL